MAGAPVSSSVGPAGAEPGFDDRRADCYLLHGQMNSFASTVRRSLRCCALVAALAVVAVSRGQSSLVANSPFAPTGSSAVASASAAGQDYELAGSTSEGRTVTVCIYVRQTHRSQWIPVGGISDGIKVLSFDADHDKAVVTVGGVTKDIVMRKATYGGKGLAASPASAAPLPRRIEPSDASTAAANQSVTAATKPEAEQREARMLVSDLLEIGVQQRKAYQEARQKAPGGTPPTPNN